jgi:hypothetical protein
MTEGYFPFGCVIVKDAVVSPFDCLLACFFTIEASLGVFRQPVRRRCLNVGGT